MVAPKKYADELSARAARLHRESDPKPVIRRRAEQLGVHHEALRNWIRRNEACRGERDDRPTTSEPEELRRLRRENAELKHVNEMPKAASAFSPRTSTRPGDGREARHAASRSLRGRAQPLGPRHRSSTYRGWVQRQADRSPRQRQDEELVAEVVDIHTISGGTCGSPRVHVTPRRREIQMFRKRVERLMRTRGLQGRSCARTGHSLDLPSAGRPILVLGVSSFRADSSD
ncbi:transposase [Lentzea sp. NPDC051208]|uniref:transposase n=1 Tax=Lentzea sp. NPDC051208 TaxID=3154642 RepID=UPI003444671A